MKKKLGIALYLIICFCIGLLLGKFITPYISENGFSTNVWLELLYTLLLGIITFHLQIIIHEAGHLVFGLLTGYKFCSFRIKSFMLIRKNGKMRLKRFKLFGTGGQCLMTPPEINGGNFPVLLYNFGGVIFNLIFTAIIFVIDFAADAKLTLFGMLFIFFGVATALLNGIPFKSKAINNDGSNAIKLSKSIDARKSFWLDLTINAKQSEGMRTKDMPSDWFYMPSDEELKNPMIASRGVSYCSLLVEKHRFEEAEKEITRLTEFESGIAGIHKNLFLCELIYLRLVLDMRFETVSELLTKELDAFMHSMRKFPAVIRARYTYALLGENNKEKAAIYKKQFQKIAKSYPYEGDLQSELELMQIVDDKVI